MLPLPVLDGGICLRCLLLSITYGGNVGKTHAQQSSQPFEAAELQRTP